MFIYVDSMGFVLVQFFFSASLKCNSGPLQRRSSDLKIVCFCMCVCCIIIEFTYMYVFDRVRFVVYF